MAAGDFLLWTGYAGVVITLLLVVWGVITFMNMRGPHFGAVAFFPILIGLVIAGLVALVVAVLHLTLGWQLGLQIYGVFPTSLVVLGPLGWFARRVWKRRKRG